MYTHPQEGGYCQSKRVSKEEREDSCKHILRTGDIVRVRKSARRRERTVIHTSPGRGYCQSKRVSKEEREDSCTHILRTGDIVRVRESVRRRERTVVHASSGRGILSE